MPAQADFLKEEFPESEIIMSTFSNPNSHNTWMLKQGETVLLVNEFSKSSRNEIILELGRSSHSEKTTGKVKSVPTPVKYGKYFRDSDYPEIEKKKRLHHINKAKLESLRDFASASDDLYEAFVLTFGESLICSDER
jgi:hypothetical protein